LNEKQQQVNKGLRDTKVQVDEGRFPVVQWKGKFYIYQEINDKGKERERKGRRKEGEPSPVRNGSVPRLFVPSRFLPSTGLIFPVNFSLGLQSAPPSSRNSPSGVPFLPPM
jgi:hypothetical protein